MGKRYLSETVKYLFLTVVFVIAVFPIIYILFSSFKTNQEILTSGAAIFPKEFQFDNFKQAWELANFKIYTWNSLYMAFFIVLGTIFTSTMAGYVFARGKSATKTIIFAVISATMFISAGVLFLYPQLQIAKLMHLNKSLWGVIIIRVFGINVTQVYLARGYINTISPEIDEAAKIDGCSYFRIFWNIIFPLLKPLIATIGLLSFMSSWNDYLLPLVFTMSDLKSAPLVVGVVSLKNAGEAASSWNLMLAGTTISVMPMIIVYLFLNRYFISGLTSGAVKG